MMQQMPQAAARKGWIFMGAGPPVLVAALVVAVVALACSTVWPATSKAWLGERLDDGLGTGTEVLEGLNTWLRREGGGDGFVALDKVRLAPQPGIGRGVEALRALSKGEVVARIPINCLVNVEHALHAFRDWGDAALDALTDLDLVAALLLEERARGAESRWAALWAAFPVNVSSSALFLSASQLDDIRGAAPRFARDVGSLQAALRARWRQSALLSRWPLLAFLTAVALVQSRVFSVSVLSQRDGRWHSAQCLVPFADLVNTCPSAGFNADCATNAAGSHFECFATEDVAAGQFLCSPYVAGMQPQRGAAALSARLWIEYGFTMPPSGRVDEGEAVDERGDEGVDERVDEDEEDYDVRIAFERIHRG